MTETIPFKVLSKNGQGFHLVMKMKVNGKIAKMIIDTGASHTVFDKTKMKKFITTKKRFTKLSNSTTGVGGTKIDSHHTTLNKISIGSISIMNYPGVMLDLAHVNATYTMMGLPEIDGVLGADIFVMFNAVIDYEKKTIKLNDKGLKNLNKNNAALKKIIETEGRKEAKKNKEAKKKLTVKKTKK